MQLPMIIELLFLKQNQLFKICVLNQNKSYPADIEKLYMRTWTPAPPPLKRRKFEASLVISNQNWACLMWVSTFSTFVPIPLSSSNQ